jgi:hypothetical protein
VGTSAKALISGVLSHYKQLIGGTLVAVVGFGSDALGLDVPRWVWAIFAGLFVGWAMLLAYHDLRTQCDAAMDGLRDKINHHELAEELTEKHALAVHKFINGKPEINNEWISSTRQWYDGVVEIMQRHRCTAGEINHVNTIAHTEIKALGGHGEFAMLHIRLNRIADIATKHGRLAEELAIAARKGHH